MKIPIETERRVVKNVGKELNGKISEKNMFRYDNPWTHTAIEIGKFILVLLSISSNSGGEKGDVNGEEET